MTTEDGSSAVAGPAGVVTKLPSRGSVLLRSPAPPEVPARRCVDVRPGAFAAFDGDRFRLSLSVIAGGERRRFDRSQLPAVAEAVTALLRGADVEDAGAADCRRGSDGGGGTRRPAEIAGVHQRAVLRFGDVAACRRLLPPPAAAAIERRLATAASRGSAPLLSWTSEAPRPVDYRDYDAVIDGPSARSE